jgi:ABC-type branched-subunit amino acid transport system substrate-binding protein
MKMKEILIGWWAMMLALSPSFAVQERPHYEARKHPAEYHGPGREDLEPEDLQEIRIGYFGPSDPDHPEGGDLWLAATMAVDEANRDGGYLGTPFRLVPGWSDSPWGTGVTRVTRMVYSDEVWAIIGSIDGASTHLAEQVVAKARVSLVSPVSTDKTVHMAHVPWMFSCLPGDHQMALLLAEALHGRVQGKREPFTMISSTDHDSRVFANELGDALSRRRLAPHLHLHVHPGVKDVSWVVQETLALQPGAVILLAGALDSARLVLALRQNSFTGLIFGGPSMGRRLFIERVGDAGEGVFFPFLGIATSTEFTRRFREGFQRSPDYAAAQTYDATRLLLQAIHRAGLNRARIRDALVELSPWKGANGPVTWDQLGQNERPVELGTIRSGRIQPFFSF